MSLFAKQLLAMWQFTAILALKVAPSTRNGEHAGKLVSGDWQEETAAWPNPYSLPVVRQQADRVFSKDDRPVLFALRNYLASVYPAAAESVASLSEGELRQVFESLDYFYHCEKNMDSEWQQEFACRDIQRDGAQKPMHTAPLPFLPSGVFYRATEAAVKSQWPYSSRTPVYRSTMPTTNSHLRSWVSQVGVFKGPAPSWVNPLAIQRYVLFPNGFSHSASEQEGFQQMPKKVADRQLNLSKAAFPEERFFARLKDGDYIEVEQSGGPFIPASGLWGNVWRGTGIFMRATRPLVSWNKGSAFADLLRHAEKQNAMTAEDKDRRLLDWFTEAFGLSKAVARLRQKHHWLGSEADLIVAAAMSMGHPCAKADRTGQFNYLKSWVETQSPTEVVDGLFSHTGADSPERPHAFGLHWITGLCGRGPMWTHEYPWRSWDHALATLASNLNFGTLILAASSNDNRLLAQEFVDVDLPERWLKELRRPDLYGEFHLEPHAEELLEFWGVTRKFQLRDPTSRGAAPLPCDLSGITREQCQTGCWIHCRGSASQSISEVPLGAMSVEYHDVMFLHKVDFYVLQMASHHRWIIFIGALCALGLFILWSQRWSYVLAFVAFICFGLEHFMIGDSVERIPSDLSSLFMPAVFTLSGLIALLAHVTMVHFPGVAGETGLAYQSQVTQLRSELWTTQGAKRMASVAGMGSAVVLAQLCCRIGFGSDMRSIGANQAVVCCDVLLVTGFFYLVFGEAVSRWSLGCIALITGGLVVTGMSAVEGATPVQLDSFVWSVAAMLLYGMGIVCLRITHMVGMPSLPAIAARLVVVGALGFAQLMVCSLQLPVGASILEFLPYWKLPLLAAAVEVIGVASVSRGLEIAKDSEPSVCVAIFGSNSVLVFLLEFAVYAAVPSVRKMQGMLMCLCGCTMAVLEPVLQERAQIAYSTWRARPMRMWEVTILLLFVLFGVSSAISVQLAGTGYSATGLVLLVEVAKLVFSQVQLSVTSGLTQQRRFASEMTARQHCLYLMTAASFVVQNVSRVYTIQLLGSTDFEILGNTKILWAAMCYVLVFRALSVREWLSLGILLLAILELQSKNIQSEDLFKRHYRWGVALVLFCSLLSGAVTVMTEYAFKNINAGHPLPFKNVVLYGWSVVILFPTLMLQSRSVGLMAMFSGFTFWTWLAVVLNAMNGITNAYLLLYRDTQVKSFACGLVIFMVAFMESTLFQKEKLNQQFFIGLATCTIALYMYQQASADSRAQTMQKEVTEGLLHDLADQERASAKGADMVLDVQTVQTLEATGEAAGTAGTTKDVKGVKGVKGSFGQEASHEESAPESAPGPSGHAGHGGQPGPDGTGAILAAAPSGKPTSTNCSSLATIACWVVILTGAVQLVATLASPHRSVISLEATPCAVPVGYASVDEDMVLPPYAISDEDQHRKKVLQAEPGRILPTESVTLPSAVRRAALVAGRDAENFDPFPSKRTIKAYELGRSNLEHYNEKCLTCQEREHPEAWPQQLGRLAGRQLLLDGFLLADSRGVSRSPEPAVDDSLALEATADDQTTPGEPGSFGCPCNLMHNGSDFLLFFRSAPSKLGLAVSKDGLQWSRAPKQPEARGFRFPAGGEWCVLDDQQAGHEGDQARYKAGFNCFPGSEEQKDLLCLATSADGISWTTAGYVAGQSATDSYPCLYHEKPGQSYDIVMRENFATVRNWRGIRGFKQSRFQMNFNSTVLGEPHTATLDLNFEKLSSWYFDMEGKNEAYRRQLYSLTRTPYAGLYLGIANVLEYPRLKSNMGDRLSAYLSTSRDGLHWDLDWVYAGNPMISAGASTCSTSGGASGAAPSDSTNLPEAKWVQPSAQLVTLGGYHWIAYDRNPSAHEDRWNTVSSIRMARFKEGRLARIALRDGEVEGELTSKPFIFDGAALSVDLRAPGPDDSVVVELLRGDAALGDEVPLARSIPLRQVDGLVRVSWQPADAEEDDGAAGEDQPPVPLLGSSLRLRFRLRGGAAIFGFDVAAQ